MPNMIKVLEVRNFYDKKFFNRHFQSPVLEEINHWENIIGEIGHWENF